MRVDDVDWSTWEPNVRATLLFVIVEGRVLLIHKQRGIGAGLINGPGGKIDPGETARQAAIRETREETGVDPTGVHEAGEMRFEFVDGMRMHVAIFRADGCDGEPVTTDEAIPEWFRVDEVPFDRMWADDELWFPHLLARHRFRGWSTFDGETLLDAVIDLSAGNGER